MTDIGHQTIQETSAFVLQELSTIVFPTGILSHLIEPELPKEEPVKYVKPVKPVKMNWRQRKLESMSPEERVKYAERIVQRDYLCTVPNIKYGGMSRNEFREQGGSAGAKERHRVEYAKNYRDPNRRARLKRENPLKERERLTRLGLL